MHHCVTLVSILCTIFNLFHCLLCGALKYLRMTYVWHYKLQVQSSSVLQISLHVFLVASQSVWSGNPLGELQSAKKLWNFSLFFNSTTVGWFNKIIMPLHDRFTQRRSHEGEGSALDHALDPSPSCLGLATSLVSPSTTLHKHEQKQWRTLWGLPPPNNFWPPYH
jgi:hypothetical protein